MYGTHTNHLDERTTALAHSRIVKMCVEHILLAHNNELHGGRTVKEGQDLQGDIEFLLYAARYWPNHSELTVKTISLDIEPFQIIVEQQELLEYWGNAYRFNLEPPSSRAGPRIARQSSISF